MYENPDSHLNEIVPGLLPHQIVCVKCADVSCQNNLVHQFHTILKFFDVTTVLVANGRQNSVIQSAVLKSNSHVMHQKLLHGTCIHMSASLSTQEGMNYQDGPRALLYQELHLIREGKQTCRVSLPSYLGISGAARGLSQRAA
jgi:hypothetical protein